jgi:hypothetical protein
VLNHDRNPVIRREVTWALVLATPHTADWRRDEHIQDRYSLIRETRTAENDLMPAGTGHPDVSRRLGIWCHCALLGCCHNEDADRFNCGNSQHDGHAHSGNPATGYLYPWTQEEYDAQQRYRDRPDPDGYPEGSLQRIVCEAELEDWRRREQELRSRAGELTPELIQPGQGFDDPVGLGPERGIAL